MRLLPSCGHSTCQARRSTQQRLLPVQLLPVLLLLLQMPDPGSPTAHNAASRSSKQHQAWWWLQASDAARPGVEFAPLENVTQHDDDKAGEASGAAGQQSSVDETGAEVQAAAAETRKQAKQASQHEATKAAIIRDFVLQHGEAIRRSRQHANLFDGSGYLIDLMDELHEFRGQAEVENRRRSVRKRRSVPGGKAEAGAETHNADNDATDVPYFASLSDALTHLNGGTQAEIRTSGFNLHFKYENSKHGSEGAGDRRRRKRSVGEGDREGAAGEADDGDTEREAEESMARLDANLQELARYLEQEAAADAAARQEERQAADAASSKQREALAKFNQRIGGAYEQLLKLKTVAADLVADKRPAQHTLHRLFSEKSADWHIEAESLRDNVRQLQRLYMQMDEL